jgi:hypothetical protein
VRLMLEIALARTAGRLSRLAGRGGGTTLPGKILATLDPGALRRLAQRLPRGSALVSATNGKTTTAAIVAEILGGRVRLAHNRAGANLVSGVASALLAARDAELGLFEVDEGAFPDVAGSGPTPSASETSSATSSIATASSSSWRSAGGLPSLSWIRRPPRS